VPDGLVLVGRLVKVVEPRSYKGRDGADRESYPGMVVLAGDETVEVQFRTLAERTAALDAALIDLGTIGLDGYAETLPRVSLTVKAVGAWDAAAGRFAPARFTGA
jgi:hypothetical protein